MKVIKPIRLGILNQTYRWQGQYHLGIAVLALADMKPSQQLRPEMELWQLIGSELSTSGGIIDLAYPKYYPEFLAVGYAYPDKQGSHNSCRVKIEVADKAKELLVFGNRYWKNNQATEPEEFNSLRVDWSSAYGGKQYANNPYGIGATPDIITSIHPLPNLEDPNQLLSSPEHEVSPVSFGPLDVSWPVRQTMIDSKYDETWLLNDFPGFPADIDKRFFNMSPLDQIWENRDHFPPGAEYLIHNMHPEQSVLQGCVPDWQARCFSHYSDSEGEEVFAEIPMRHTTVWFFPHLEKMILVYHGQLTINEDDASDVYMLMPALESLSQPRSLDHYQKVWLQRTDKKYGVSYFFRDEDLLPQAALGLWQGETELNDKSGIGQHLQAKKAQVKEEVIQKIREIDTKSRLPDINLDTTTLQLSSLQNLPEFMLQAETLAEKEKQNALALLDQKAQEFDTDINEYRNKKHTAMDSYTQLKEALKLHEEHKITPSLEKKEDLPHTIYLSSVATHPAAQRLNTEKAQTLRKWVEEKLAGDRDFSGTELTGADLSHLDFSNANFYQAKLESADLSHSILDDANLAQAILARCELHHASLQRVNLTDANLAEVDCQKSSFIAANFHQTSLEGALLDQCSFQHAIFTQMLFKQTQFTQCDFQHATFKDSNFYEVALDNLNFSQALFYKTSFLNNQLTAANFDQSVLNRCTWLSCDMTQCQFNGSQITQSAFAAETTLNQTQFKKALLTTCNFRNLTLQYTNLQQATLINCDFSNASLVHADLSNIDAPGTMFVRTDFSHASLMNANLIGAQLRKSKLIGCNLSFANLFRADLSQTEQDDTTNLQNSYQVQTKLHPLYQGAASC